MYWYKFTYTYRHIIQIKYVQFYYCCLLIKAFATLSERTTIQHTLLLWQLFSVIDVKNGCFVIIYPSIYIFFYEFIFLFCIHILIGWGTLNVTIIMFHIIIFHIYTLSPSTHTSFTYDKRKWKIRSVVIK